MKWRPTRQRPRRATVVADPLVLTITEPLTRATADELVSRVGRLAAGNPVVVDVTGISDFDSTGAAAIVGLQETLGPERLTIVGFRQATARLIGDPTDDDAALPEQHAEWVVRRMRAIVVVHPSGDDGVTTDNLEPAVTAALAEESGIVVVDLRGAALTARGVQTVAFASSAAALRGQELLVVNVDATAAARLRHAGLSATTYVAPEPLTDN